MNVSTFFFQRYNDLHNKFLPGLRESLSEEDFRIPAVPGLQPIIWLIWHIARVEDMGLSRFIFDVPQMLDEEWLKKMNTPLTHYGTSMTEEEVLTFAQTVDVYGILDYQQAVVARTRSLMPSLDQVSLDELLSEEVVNQIVLEEGMASDKAHWVIPHYVGKTKGWMLCHMGLTHSFRHFGQITLSKKLPSYLK